ncbi:DoxX family protein [Corynebacterium freneyi]|uniref:DoxX family protein n=1 Tax=Corynebacterium freneyi DNF00450 TaxID=1287475 RepID=A0A095Y1P1_9CORY|nr:DoxX family protein [Corynebacterium freneyi]KGF15971.1 hypothetical protein HMPREF1650_09450 [Corynebacterium freneyi DNF00450]
MSDNTKNPNPRNLGDYEEGLDDDFDVPTYRRIADDGPEADVAPDTDAEPGTELETRLEPEQDAPTEILDGTGAGPIAGDADGSDEAIAAATSSSLDDADVDAAGADEPEEAGEAAETQVIPRRDIYAVAGRTAPQTIEPLAKTEDYREADADFADAAEQPTQVAPAVADDDVPETMVVDDRSDLDARDDYARDYDRDDYDRDDALLDEGAAPTAGTVGAAGAAGVAGATVADSDDPDFRDDDRDRDFDPRRGTLDLGLLLLRLGVGGMVLMLGLATFFQFGGAPGIGTLEAQFAANGYNFAGVIAVAIPTVQVIAGGLLVLGLATPLGAALALAISAFLTMFEVAVGDSGWNVLAAGAEPVRLQLALTASALALQFTGPGRYGIDFSRGWARRPLASSWIFCLLAIAAAVALWYFSAGQLPFVDTTTGATA